MKKTVFGFVVLGLVVGGCESSNKQAANRGPLRPAVLDVAPAAPQAYASTPQPVAVAQPVEQPASFAPVTVATAASGSTYTVQKGDTLYKIAREKLGDAKQWKAIAAANPGLSPNSLKAGQKIVLP